MATRRFRRGDHVSWNSEAGRVSGPITRVVSSEIQFKGYAGHASGRPLPASISRKRVRRHMMDHGIRCKQTRVE